MAGIIESVDHIMVRVERARPLFNLFSGTLGLPVSWPLQEREFATFGWITLGNANLEFWQASSNADLTGKAELPIFHGIALEPCGLAASTARLAASGITCKKPRSFLTKKPDGREVANFTNSVIVDASSETCCVFFCEWCADGTIFPWTDRLATAERRQRQKAQLVACDGGPLGVTGLVEIQMQLPLRHGARAAWAAVTGGQGQVADLADGVRLRLLPGPQYKVDELVIGVRSLGAAREVLAQNALLERGHASDAILLKQATGGLTFRFRQTA